MNEEGKETAEEEIPVIHVEPNPFWKQNAEKLVGESISSIETTAGQFVVITSLLQGIYFHAIAYTDLRIWFEYSILIYIAPVVLWLLSLIFAVMVYFRGIYEININSSEDSKRVFHDVLKKKCSFIQISGVFLIFSFVALTVAILHYLGVIFS